MSSPEEDGHDGDSASQNAKKRRIQRACDVCRRKKIRCDGGQMPGNRCSNCVSYRYECTYVEAAKKRGPPKGYVESLETRLAKMEKLLNKLCPNADFSKELGGPFDKDGWLVDRSSEASGSKSTYSTMTQSAPGASSTPSLVPSTPGIESDFDPSDDELVAAQTIVLNVRKMKANPVAMRYFGKSSSLMFIQTAMDMKNEYSGTNMQLPVMKSDDHDNMTRRQRLWGLQPWLVSSVETEHSPHKEFPPPDLMESLIDIFFSHINDFLPMLHRPSFEASIRDGLHLRDEGFGSTVLLVCANGARFSEDPRVRLKEYESQPQSAGWQWFQQVQMVRKSLLAPPRLYDLQIYALTASFMQGTSAPQACWTIIGVGIRMAQDVGAHRKKVYSAAMTIEEELWKRAFWVLVALDRSASAALGRPCAIQDEDFDLDLPIECDDEYWAHPDPSLAWKQPPGKPSKTAFFNAYIKLQQIMAFALRTIYSINKSRALLGFVGQQWEQHIVAELDSALNRWIDSVPDHLRWDPHQENLLFLNQSANIYSCYYQVQIAVHRPFIPSPRKPSPLSFPSLAICTNAARSCTHVLDVQYKRTGKPFYSNQMAYFTAGIVLLLNIWGGKRSGLNTDPVKEMADVHKCMKMLKLLEQRWHTAGRLWDILYELACVGDLPLPQASPTPSQKRERDADSPNSAASPSSATAGPSEGVRNIAPSRARRTRDPTIPPHLAGRTGPQPIMTEPLMMGASEPPAPTPTPAPAPPPAPQDEGTARQHFLPLHTDELGRLPLFNVTCAGDAVHAWDQSTLSQPFDQSMFVTPPPAATAAAAYGEMFGLAPHHQPQQQPQQQQQQYPTGLTTMGSNEGGFGVMGPGPGIEEDMSFTDGALAMWSNAPVSFEWDDWGQYITNVTGGMNGTHPPPGP